MGYTIAMQIYDPLEEDFKQLQSRVEIPEDELWYFVWHLHQEWLMPTSIIIAGLLLIADVMVEVPAERHQFIALCTLINEDMYHPQVLPPYGFLRA